MPSAQAEALYIVTDGLPGPEPGSAAFVELETADGHGRGPEAGPTWGRHPSAAGLYRLGPFYAAPVPEPSSTSPSEAGVEPLSAAEAQAFLERIRVPREPNSRPTWTPRELADSDPGDAAAAADDRAELMLLVMDQGDPCVRCGSGRDSHRPANLVACPAFQPMSIPRLARHFREVDALLAKHAP